MSRFLYDVAIFIKFRKLLSKYKKFIVKAKFQNHEVPSYLGLSINERKNCEGNYQLLPIISIGYKNECSQ